MIYLDNAATSFPKPECVCREMDRCMREYCANPGRSGHPLSLKAGAAVMASREAICSLFNICDPMRLVFTKNATEALNIAIKGTAFSGCHVITTSMEHNSVMRPLRALERDIGIEVTVVRGNELGEIDPDDIRKEIKKNTVLIISTLSSNVNGIVMPIKELGYIASQSDLAFLVDASQGAGSMAIDVEELNISMMAFPGHKGLLGPQGTGCLYVSNGIPIKTLMEGGTGSNSDSHYQPDFLPDMLESGTLNTPGIVGLGTGASYIATAGAGQIAAQKHRLVKILIEGFSQIPGVNLYSVSDINRNSGIVAINLRDLDSGELSYILDKEYGIYTRAGFHCSPGAHKTLGTEKTGVVRFSPSLFNKVSEMIYTLDALEKISWKTI